MKWVLFIMIWAFLAFAIMLWNYCAHTLNERHNTDFFY